MQKFFVNMRALAIVLLLSVTAALAVKTQKFDFQEFSLGWDKPCEQTVIEDRIGNEVPFEGVDDALTISVLGGIANLKISQYRSNLRKHGWKLKKIIYNFLTSTEGFVAENKQTGDICVAFRATQQLRDWLLDANIAREQIAEGVLVHKGFNKAVDRIYDELVRELTPYINQGSKIYITGFSLGAGLTGIFTYKLAASLPSENRDQLWAIMFGAPPTGNRGFVEGLRNMVSNTYDIVQIGDKVSYKRCDIPLALSLLGYRRTEVYYLPKEGAHIYLQYQKQLNSIQTKEDYDKEYGLTEDEVYRKGNKVNENDETSPDVFDMLQKLLGNIDRKK